MIATFLFKFLDAISWIALAACVCPKLSQLLFDFGCRIGLCDREPYNPHFRAMGEWNREREKTLRETRGVELLNKLFKKPHKIDAKKADQLDTALQLALLNHFSVPMPPQPSEDAILKLARLLSTKELHVPATDRVGVVILWCLMWKWGRADSNSSIEDVKMVWEMVKFFNATNTVAEMASMVTARVRFGYARHVLRCCIKKAKTIHDIMENLFQTWKPSSIQMAHSIHPGLNIEGAWEAANAETKQLLSSIVSSLADEVASLKVLDEQLRIQIENHREKDESQAGESEGK